MPDAKKITQVEQIKDKWSRAEAVILAEYRGLTVFELTELRRALRQEKMEFKVYKNRLVKQALNNEKPDLDEYLEGPVGFTFSYDDPAAPARILAGFAKEHEHLVLKAGVVAGEVLNKERVDYLATVPGREELLQRLVSAMSSPMSSLVRVLQGPLQNMVRVLQQIKDKKEK